jgi:hypothetical protein
MLPWLIETQGESRKYIFQVAYGNEATTMRDKNYIERQRIPKVVANRFRGSSLHHLSYDMDYLSGFDTATTLFLEREVAVMFEVRVPR